MDEQILVNGEIKSIENNGGNDLKITNNVYQKKKKKEEKSKKRRKNGIIQQNIRSCIKFHF